MLRICSTTWPASYEPENNSWTSSTIVQDTYLEIDLEVKRITPSAG